MPAWEYHFNVKIKRYDPYYLWSLYCAKKNLPTIILSILKIMISINVTNSKYCTLISIEQRVEKTFYAFLWYHIAHSWKCIFQMKPPHHVLFICQIQKEWKKRARCCFKRGLKMSKNENFKYGMQWTVKWRCHSTNRERTVQLCLYSWETHTKGREQKSACHPRTLNAMSLV